nr:bifunctional chorismate mutase/prephenate dehydratase [Candidatus Dojkabacteria bacterium]
GLFIIKEIYLKINFHLIVNKGVKFNDIKKIYTHRVSMSQIKSFLEANPQIEAHIYEDNGKAAEYIKKENLKDSAAAASKLAAEIYDLEIIKENIHDNPKNYTRFFVLSRESNYEEKSDKTSISFLVKHETGTLVKALKCFSDEDISLTKIESRPLIDTNWEYIFYVDLLAGINEKRMKRALDKAKEITLELKILGSYKQGEYINT